MSIIKKLKESAKQVPYPVYIAGIIVPGGLCAIALYLAYKASQKDKPKPETIREFMDRVIAEERKNDRN